MISTIQFTHGVKNCAVEKGVFCRWQGASGFGTRPHCALFKTDLFEDIDEQWLQRCQQCVDAFGSEE